MTIRKRDGSRVIELFQPFDNGGGLIIEAVTLRPVTLEHVLRWQRGFIKGPMQLMSELSGLTVAQLGAVTYPDAAALLDEFFLHVPSAIRQSVADAKEAPATIPAPDHEEPSPAAPGAPDAPFNPADWEGMAPDRSMLDD